MGCNFAIKEGRSDEVGQVIVSPSVWIAARLGVRHDTKGVGNAIGLAVLIAIPRRDASGLKGDASHVAGTTSVQFPLAHPSRYLRQPHCCVCRLGKRMAKGITGERPEADRHRDARMPGRPDILQLLQQRVHHCDAPRWRTRNMNRSSRRARTRGVEVFAQT